MRTLAFAALTAGLVMTGAPVAHAEHIVGECDYRSNVLFGAVADPAGGIIEVDCWLQVNGVKDPSSHLDVDGTGMAADAWLVAEPGGSGDVLEVCTEVVQPSPGHTECVAPDRTTPPVVDEIIDVLNEIMDLLNDAPGLGSLVDSLSCDVLRALSPGVPGVIDIDPTGDTYVAGEFVWDCPPYEV